MSFSQFSSSQLVPHRPCSSPCVMLPPIHPSSSSIQPQQQQPIVTSAQPPTTLTLSDCSEVSLMSRDDSNNHLILHQQYQLACSVSTHSTMSPQYQQQPQLASTSQQNTPRIKIPKTPNKIARARTRLPSKMDSNSTYRPLTTKKVRSSKSNIPGESRYWTPSEHKLFVEALLKYGPKDLKSISAYVGTRNMIQCRTHEQKCFMRLMREAQRETFQRNGQDFDDPEERRKLQKDVYSVPPSCGITLLCVVGEEMSRSLQS